MNEIAIVSNIKHKSLMPCYRMPVLELDYKVSIVDTTKCIITVANKVGVSEMAKQYATNLIDEVTKKGNECRKKSRGACRKVVYIMYQNK
jgi:transcription initiation factor TFIIIB Brf1 subunit/transcription initiation factor TFIIB